MRTLHYVARFGLGNRLLPLLSMIRLLKLGVVDYCVIDWLENTHCGASFDNLFSHNLDGLHIASTPYIGEVQNCWNHMNIQDINGVMLDTITRPFCTWNAIFCDDDLCRQDSIAAGIRDAAQHLIFKHYYKLDQTYIGLHCRRTDSLTHPTGAIYLDADDPSNLNLIHYLINEQFLEFIAKHITDDRPLFLSTDSTEALTFLRSIFGDRLKSLNITLPTYQRYIPIRDYASTIGAMLDFTALTQCEMILGDGNSTFANVASIIGRRPYYFLDRKAIGPPMIGML